ncbi:MULTISPECIES: DUF6098 family protein [unclassified Streptomyces]|uniref:DUF6098 family protein n=1 Tax=unclassified Streptomyces TaxID=2593676 RepID=UPI0004BE194D|nr:MULTISPECIES: DUF6098 family protein [unclassified Streptomyces]KOV79552.1 hypothetical protein ADL02_23885 [Streptomyces sp. NRRL WC-3723]MBG7696741.1 hypothetical protein [Streptomyces sp. MC1]
MSGPDDLPVMSTLAEVARLVKRHRGLYVRWSKGPGTDLDDVSSTDELTGVPMPGLSANPLDVENWWEDRSVELWVARRLYDYAHLPHDKGPGVRPWVLRGRETGRGPDNEPLVADVEPLCWIADEVIDAARDEVSRQEREWGTLRRGGR